MDTAGTWPAVCDSLRVALASLRAKGLLEALAAAQPAFALVDAGEPFAAVVLTDRPVVNDEKVLEYTDGYRVVRTPR